MTDPFAGQQPGMQQFGQQPAFQQVQPAASQPNFQQAPPAAPQQPDQWGQQEAAPPTNADTSGLFSGGGATISFADKAWMGKPRGGQIIGKRMTNQTEPGGKVKMWDDNTPRKQVVVTLQTNERVSAEDDGKRDLYVKSGMVAAVRDAIRESGVGDLEVGGWLFVAWTGEKPTTKGNPMKLFSAQYTRLGSPPPALASQPVQMPQSAPPAAAPAPQQYAPQAQPGFQPMAGQPTMSQEQAAGVFGGQPAPQQPVANPFG